MVLCKVYNKSSRGGPGSSGVPSRCATAPAPARKRKAADGVERRPEAPTRARRRRQLLLTGDDDDDDAMSFSEILESELLRYFETENAPAGGEPAAPERQDRPMPAAPPPCAAQQNKADDDDVMEISLEEFLGSSAAGAAPPRTAQPESGAAASCIQASSQHGQSTDADVVEVSPEKKMMGASAPSERSGTPSALTDDEDDGGDMCGLACPPMDEAYVELILSQPLVQFDPTFIEEFISDL